MSIRETNSTLGNARMSSISRAVGYHRVSDVGELILSFSRNEGRVAITYYDKGDSKSISYGQLSRKISIWGRYLRNKYQVSSGDKIIVCADNNLSFPILALAIMSLGAAVVPINPSSEKNMLMDILAQIDVKVAYVDADVPDDMRNIIGTFAQHILEEPIEAADYADDQSYAGAPALKQLPALILFTSGTTGHPKGVVLSQQAIVSNAMGMVNNFGFEKTVQMAIMPLFHAHAFGFGLMTSLLTGSHLVLMRGLQMKYWASVMREENVEFVSMVPSLLHVIAKMNVTQDDLPSLKGVLVSSAPLQKDLANSFIKNSGINLFHGWGLSEYTNFACCTKVGAEESYYELMYQQEKTLSIGHQLIGTEISVQNEKGTLLGENEVGELCIRGGSLMTGYYNNKVETDKAMGGGWLRSGDLGYWLNTSAGKSFYITGRKKEIIIRAGEKYSPMIIESYIEKMVPSLETGKYAVVGFESKIFGEEIGLYIKDDGQYDKENIIEGLEVISFEMRPKVVLFSSDDVPVTATGKVKRNVISQLFVNYKNYTGATKFISIN